MKSVAATQAREAVPDPATRPEPAAQPRGGRPAARGGQHFAEVPAAAGRGAPDDDQLTTLLGHIASQLGIRPGSIRIESGDGAIRITSQAGAPGVTHKGVIHIPQARLSPTTLKGRRLLAHEAAHLAQMQLPAGGRFRKPTPLQAEVEAELFARRYAATRTAEPVRVALPTQAVATYDELLEIVAKNHPLEIAAITDLMSYGPLDWAVTDREVFDVLQILASYTLPVARGIFRAVDPTARKHFYDNLNAPHFARHRGEILAACWAAVSEQEFAVTSYDILSRMNLDDLGTLESIALDKVADLSPKMVAVAVKADGVKSKRINDAHAYVDSGKATKDAEKELKEGNDGEAKLTADRESADARRKALDEADPQGALYASTIAERIDSEKLDEVRAAAILEDIQLILPRVLDQQPAVDALVLRIGVPRISRLLDHISARALYGDQAQRNAFIQLAAARPPYLNVQLADHLMTSPWWKVWDDVTVEEAYGAYLLVKSLPTRGRTAFLKSRAGERWAEILKVLPTSVREDPTFNFYDGGKDGGRDQADRQGLLAALTDPALWKTAAGEIDPAAEGEPPAKPPQPNPLERLEMLIRLAQAAGEGLFVFAESERQRADLKPPLKTLVATYKLYNKTTRPKYEKPVLSSEKPAGSNVFDLAIGALDTLRIDWKSGALQLEADLGVLNEMGGARFRPTTPDELAAEEKAGTSGRNVVHAEWGNGWFRVEAPLIVIEALSMAGDTSVHTGAITVEGLRLDLRYEPGMTRFSVKQLRSIDVAFDAITIADLNVAMSDSILVAKSMRITGGQVKMGSQSVKDDAQAVWIWNMLGMILNPAGANNAALSFNLMALRSLAMSSGVFIELIEIEGFGFEAGGDASSYVEALIKSVGRLKPRAAAERQAAKSDPEHAERHLQEAARIDRHIAKAQEEIDRGEPHGAVVDIGAIRISGIPGVSDKPLNIADIHGQGRSVTAVVPIFTDPTSLRNLIRGRDNASSIAGRQPEAEQFSIDIGRIEAKEPLRLAGGIPTSKKAQEEYDDFIKVKSGRRYDEGATPVEQALRDRVTQATRYEALAARGVQNLVGEEPKQFRELRVALTLFEERRATIVEALVLEGVSLNITGDGNPELVAETLKTGVIRTFGPDGAEALTIGGVEGRKVAVGAALSGGLANYKEWRKALQSGTLRADQLTLKDIRHAGSGASIDELSFESQGDAKGLDVTLDRGSPETGGSSVHVRSGKIVAKGLNAPSHAALLRAEMNRIKAIKPEERTKDELKRLDVIGQMLREYEEINSARAKAELASAKARTKPARAAAAKALDKALLKLKDWQDRLVIEKLTIDQLDLAISGLGDVLAEGYAFDKDAKALKVSGGAKGKPWVQKIEAEGVKTRGATGDQTVAERITLGPIGGDVVRTDKGYAILGLTVASLGVKGLSWRSGATTVQSIGETRLEGLSITANYEKQGGATRIFIVQAGVKQIVADQLRYEDDTAVVTVKSGSLVGITVSRLDVTLPDEGDPVIAEGGEIAVEKVRALTIDALAGGKKVAAQVDSRNPADVAAISVSFAKAGERTLSLNGLGAEAEVSDPKSKSRLHVSLKRLSGSVTQKGDDYHVRNLFIGDITATDVHWVSSPWTIDVPGKVTLSGISVDAEASLRKKPQAPGAKPKLDAKGKPVEEKELSKLQIKALNIREIAAREVTLTSPKVEKDKFPGVKYRPQRTIDLKEAVISGLRITGYDLLAKTGKIEVTQSIKVTDLKATIGEETAKGLKGHNDRTTASASFTVYGKEAKEAGDRARELSATITAKDGTRIKLGRVQDLQLKGLDILGEEEGKPGVASQTGVSAVTVPGVDIGDVILTKDMVQVLGMKVDAPVDVNYVTWKTGSGDKKIHLSSAKIPQAVSVGTITARFKPVTEKDPDTGKDVEATQLDRLMVEDINIPKVTGTTFLYEGLSGDPKKPGQITVSLAEAAIEDITFSKLEKDVSARTLGLTGHVGKVTAPRFVGALSKAVGQKKGALTFGGEIEASNLTAAAVKLTTSGKGADEKTDITGGAFVIETLGIRNILAGVTDPERGAAAWGLGGNPLQKLPHGLSASASGIRLDKNGASAASIDLHNLWFGSADLGVSLDIETISVPQGISKPNKGPIRVPEGVIKKASFRIQDLSALLGGEGGGSDDSLIDKREIFSLLDKLNGKITGELGVPYFWTHTVPLEVLITNGKIDYRHVFEEATRKYGGLRDALDVQLTMDDDILDGKGTYLTLEVKGFNQVSWTPGDEAEREEMEKGQVSVSRLASPDPEAEKKDKKPSSFDWKAIEIHEVLADLGIKGKTVLNLKDYGRITLGTGGRDAISDLKVIGKDKGHVTWSIGGFAAEVNELKLPGLDVNGLGGPPAELLIDGVTNGRLDFHNGQVGHPGALEGTINSATVRNLVLQQKSE